MAKVFVNVSFQSKESAKRAGAKWDWVAKSWYFEDVVPPSFQTKHSQSFEQRLAEAKRKHQESKLCKA